MHRRRALVAAMGLLIAVLGPAGVAHAATATADVEDYGYRPGTVRIEPGDRVRWRNQGKQVHTVTTDDVAAEDFNSGSFGEGEEYSHTFSQAGTYRYHCEVHDSMKGVVQVGEAATTTTSSTTTTSTSTTTTTRPAPATTSTTTTTTTTPTRPAPPTTTTTASPPTTVTTVRGPSAAESPASTVTTAPRPTTTTTAPALTTTTSSPESTTTTAVEETTTTTAAAEAGSALGPEIPPPPAPQQEDGEGDLTGQAASAPRSGESGGGANFIALLLVAALLGAGAFGGWTLWKLRPEQTS